MGGFFLKSWIVLDNLLILFFSKKDSDHGTIATIFEQLIDSEFSDNRFFHDQRATLANYSSGRYPNAAPGQEY